MGIRNQEAQPFEILTNGSHLVEHHLKPRYKCPGFEWSRFQMVGTLAQAQTFETGPPIIQPFKKSPFKMVRFQIPFVFHENDFFLF